MPTALLAALCVVSLLAMQLERNAYDARRRSAAGLSRRSAVVVMVEDSSLPIVPVSEQSLDSTNGSPPPTSRRENSRPAGVPTPLGDAVRRSPRPHFDVYLRRCVRYSIVLARWDFSRCLDWNISSPSSFTSANDSSASSSPPLAVDEPSSRHTDSAAGVGGDLAAAAATAALLLPPPINAEVGGEADALPTPIDSSAAAARVPLLSGDALYRRLRGKRVLFLGDSVARNSFVLTMALMCNAEFYDRCMTRMPTAEFDLGEQLDSTKRGPLGCVPAHAGGGPGVKSLCYREGTFHYRPIKGLTTAKWPTERSERRSFIQRGKIGPAMEMTFRNATLLYLPVQSVGQIVKVAQYWRRHVRVLGKVAVASLNQPAGSQSVVPQLSARSRLVGAASPGASGPQVEELLVNETPTVEPVSADLVSELGSNETEGRALFSKVADHWIASATEDRSYLRSDGVICSIGPHLKLPQLQAVPASLPPALMQLRQSVPITVPFVVAEFVSAVGVPRAFSHFVTDLMQRLKADLRRLHIGVAPQRFLTEWPMVLRKVTVEEADVESRGATIAQSALLVNRTAAEVSRWAVVGRGKCGYYDNQHPALRCQSALTDVLLAQLLLLGAA